MSARPGEHVTVRLRCGRCRRVLATLPWRGTWKWAEGAAARDSDGALSYQCRCGARPSISPGRLAKAGMRAQLLGAAGRDLDTDTADYGLDAPCGGGVPWEFAATPRPLRRADFTSLEISNPDEQPPGPLR